MFRPAKISTLLTLVSTAILMMAVVQVAQAQDAVTIPIPLDFSENSGASHEVESECMLQSKLPQFIKDYSRKVDVNLVDDAGDNAQGRVLTIEIINVLGAGGGAWSGSKAVTVKGELTENGEVVGTFTAARYSSGGAFGGFKGTCAILGRCVKSMGKDIAGWLVKPTMDARLGNA
jgi:hypothetical protein